MEAGLNGIGDKGSKGARAEALAAELADRIVAGDLAPGCKLDEDAVASAHAVSRALARETLAVLEATMLVARRPDGGAEVLRLPDDHLSSLGECLAELEGACARYCAARMTADDRRALEREHEASARLVRAGALGDYASFDVAFHTRIRDGARSPVTSEMSAVVRGRLAPFRRARFREAGRLAQSWSEHDAIVTAILRGDAQGAGSAARAHVLAGAATLRLPGRAPGAG